ncbi:MAG: sigma-70 family RNA polymerase sigma factor [Gemmatimonadales bacterium]|nr:sigma-70 family RNA polymerase sigma factor [Gemmatimonadales bacterium]
MDDRELIARVRAGDARAERLLYDRHVDRVWGLVSRIVGDADDAADAAQEAFVKVFERLGDFRGESSLGTWIGAIAIRAALGRRRARGTREQRYLPLDDAPEVAGRDAAGDVLLRDRVGAAVDALPDGYRTVFVLHDVEGYTHEEIGALLGVETGTSKAQLSRARAKLRTMLAGVR